MSYEIDDYVVHPEFGVARVARIYRHRVAIVLDCGSRRLVRASILRLA